MDCELSLMERSNTLRSMIPAASCKGLTRGGHLKSSPMSKVFSKVKRACVCVWLWVTVVAVDGMWFVQSGH